MNKENGKDWHKFKQESEIEDEDLLDEELTEDKETNQHNPALEHPSYAELEEKLTLAEQEAYENREKFARVSAELSNVQRRAVQDVEKAHLYGQKKLIESFLPVIDSLEQALQLSEAESSTGMQEGLALTLKLFVDAMKKVDVEQIDPQGLIFNPHEHEAMSMQAVPNVEPNTIFNVFQKGYKLNDRVIRPARVIVAK